jgi:hypothetical protein
MVCGEFVHMNLWIKMTYSLSLIAKYANGEAWDREVLKMWKDEGWKGTDQVYFKDPVSGIKARLDGVARKGDEFVYLENKFSGAELSGNQKIIYPKIASGEAVPVGEKALEAFGRDLKYKQQNVLINATPK